jgi:F-type H+-transporting ATPase subunit gamma
VLRFGRDLRAEFLGLGDHPSFLQTVPVARVAIDDYMSGFVDQVVLVYPSFVSTLNQRPELEILLPVESPATVVPRRAEFIYEPSAAAVLSELLPRFVETKVYEALLETVASEHAARMMAMRSATENANEIIHDLSLSYNQARQATITRELIEIVSGAEIGAR